MMKDGLLAGLQQVYEYGRSATTNEQSASALAYEKCGTVRLGEARAAERSGEAGGLYPLWDKVGSLLNVKSYKVVLPCKSSTIVSASSSC